MVAKICLLLLSTGARLNEILSSRWVQLDRKSSTLRIAAEDSKNRRIRHIQLNSTSMNIINNLDTEGKYEYLFINHKTGQRFRSIHKVWDKFRKKAELHNFRLHDLRHTHASMLANAGVSIYTIQNVLSHSDPSTTQKYAHLSKKTLQDASNEVSLIINSAMQFKPKAEEVAVE
jgi:integrase